MVTDKIQDSVEITRWDRKYRDDFIRLNREWIESFFCLEESDLKILGDPEGGDNPQRRGDIPCIDRRKGGWVLRIGMSS